MSKTNNILKITANFLAFFFSAVLCVSANTAASGMIYQVNGMEARFLIYLGMEVPSSSMEVIKHGLATIVSFIQVNVMKQSPISRRTTHSLGIPMIFPYPKLFNGGKREYV